MNHYLFSVYAAYNTRAFKRSKFARPYICRLIVFGRLTCPSTGPLLQGDSSAAATAAYSWRSPTAKFRSSTTAHCSALSNQVGNAATACSFIRCPKRKGEFPNHTHVYADDAQVGEEPPLLSGEILLRLLHPSGEASDRGSSEGRGAL